MGHIQDADGVLGSGVRRLAAGLVHTDRSVGVRSESLTSNTTEVAGLKWCRTCGCVWAGDWPYGSCDEECWCAKQDDPFWHAQTKDYESNESEDISGSDDLTQKMPQVQEDR